MFFKNEDDHCECLPMQRRPGGGEAGGVGGEAFLLAPLAEDDTAPSVLHTQVAQHSLGI